MPVTKTAKRALKSSKRKEIVNNKIRKELEVAMRLAKKSKKKNLIIKAISLVDKAAKNKIIHKNKAARTIQSLSKLAKLS